MIFNFKKVMWWVGVVFQLVSLGWVLYLGWFLSPYELKVVTPGYYFEGLTWDPHFTILVRGVLGGVKHLVESLPGGPRFFLWGGVALLVASLGVTLTGVTGWASRGVKFVAAPVGGSLLQNWIHSDNLSSGVVVNFRLFKVVTREFLASQKVLFETSYDAAVKLAGVTPEVVASLGEQKKLLLEGLADSVLAGSPAQLGSQASRYARGHLASLVPPEEVVAPPGTPTWFWPVVIVGGVALVAGGVVLWKYLNQDNPPPGPTPESLLLAQQASLENSFASVKGKVNTLSTQMDEVAPQVGNITLRVTKLTAQMDKVTSQLNANTTQVGKLTTLSVNTVTRGELRYHVSRFSEVENAAVNAEVHGKINQDGQTALIKSLWFMEDWLLDELKVDSDRRVKFKQDNPLNKYLGRHD